MLYVVHTHQSDSPQTPFCLKPVISIRCVYHQRRTLTQLRLTRGDSPALSRPARCGWRDLCTFSESTTASHNMYDFISHVHAIHYDLLLIIMKIPLIHVAWAPRGTAPRGRKLEIYHQLPSLVSLIDN